MRLHRVMMMTMTDFHSSTVASSGGMHVTPPVRKIGACRLPKPVGMPWMPWVISSPPFPSHTNRTTSSQNQLLTKV